MLHTERRHTKKCNERQGRRAAKDAEEPPKLQLKKCDWPLWVAGVDVRGLFHRESLRHPGPDQRRGTHPRLLPRLGWNPDRQLPGMQRYSFDLGFHEDGSGSRPRMFTIRVEAFDAGADDRDFNF